MSNEIKEEFLEEYSIWNNFPELAESILFRDFFLKKDDKSQNSLKEESLNESLVVNETSFNRSNKSFTSKCSRLSRSISPITRRILNKIEKNEENNSNQSVDRNELKKSKNVKFELDNDATIQNNPENLSDNEISKDSSILFLNIKPIIVIA
jgi:hypothetical protein